MDATQTYMSVLIDTLQKKKVVLEQIYEVTKHQKEILQSKDFAEEEFDKTFAVKDKCLKELEKLDKGFEQVYERVALILKHNREDYKEKILISQQLIKEIMDLNVSIRAMEEQNKERFSICVAGKKGKMKTFRTSSKVVANYYKNMPNTHQTGQSYFLNKKN